MAEARPEVVVVAAARVGGILANATWPAAFIYDNLMIAANVIHAAYQVGVHKLLFLGSSCIYPRLAPQPMPETCLLEGQLEPSNQWYAVAKIAGLKLAQAYRRQYGSDFISAMPTNLYGPGDNFDLLSSHVVPALIAKMHAAKVAGARRGRGLGHRPAAARVPARRRSGRCLRAPARGLQRRAPINLGCGEDLTIAELAEQVRRVVGFAGRLRFDPERPDGTPQKLLDVTRLTALGWRPRIPLDHGLAATYQWYLDHAAPITPQPGPPAPKESSASPSTESVDLTLIAPGHGRRDGRRGRVRRGPRGRGPQCGSPSTACRSPP